MAPLELVVYRRKKWCKEPLLGHAGAVIQDHALATGNQTTQWASNARSITTKGI